MGKAVINRFRPIHTREQIALCLTNRDQRKIRVAIINRFEVLEIDSSMHR